MGRHVFCCWAQRHASTGNCPQPGCPIPCPFAAGEEAKALVAPRLLDFWRFFRAEAAHAARQALSGKESCTTNRFRGAASGSRQPTRVSIVSNRIAIAPVISLVPTDWRPPPPGPFCPAAVRDLLAWAGFIAVTHSQLGLLPAYAHGAHLVLLDGIGLGVGLSAEVRAVWAGLPAGGPVTTTGEAEGTQATLECAQAGSDFWCRVYGRVAPAPAQQSTPSMRALILTCAVCPCRHPSSCATAATPSCSPSCRPKCTLRPRRQRAAARCREGRARRQPPLRPTWRWTSACGSRRLGAGASRPSSSSSAPCRVALLSEPASTSRRPPRGATRCACCVHCRCVLRC